MNLKRFLIAFLTLLYKSMCAQPIFLPDSDKDKLGFDVRIEYFNHLDSAFAVQEHLAEIVMNEQYWEEGKLIYDKPSVIYRFDEQGRRIYVEQSYWLAIGFTRRYNHFYKDSTIGVQHEKYNYTDGNKRDAKYVFKCFVLNDSLTTSMELFYEFDSLIRVNYKDTLNKKAELRKKLVVEENSTVAPFEIIAVEIEKTFPYSDLRMYSKPYDREPEPEIIKDTMGKITEIHTNRYMRTEAKNVMVLPESSYFVKYIEPWKKVAEITKYSHWSNQKLQDQLNGKQIEYNSLQDLSCLSDSCIVYRIMASDFISGVPQKIDILVGRESKPNRSYICTIKTY